MQEMLKEADAPKKKKPQKKPQKYDRNVVFRNMDDSDDPEMCYESKQCEKKKRSSGCKTRDVQRTLVLRKHKASLKLSEYESKVLKKYQTKMRKSAKVMKKKREQAEKDHARAVELNKTYNDDLAE